ncbi:MAG TPA: hypothetical protein VNZ53_08605, partial [Steroidobacteraceae bacterium]|nr:hypothetical protein [Steroidobacteraceae bacterium]
SIFARLSLGLYRAGAEAARERGQGQAAEQYVVAPEMTSKLAAAGFAAARALSNLGHLATRMAFLACGRNALPSAA